MYDSVTKVTKLVSTPIKQKTPHFGPVERTKQLPDKVKLSCQLADFCFGPILNKRA
jgi:hypothetical protein